MRPRIKNATILITGASAGIGRELARQLARRAGTLILVARRADRLEELRAELQKKKPGLTVHLEPCDLSEPVAIEAMLASVANNVGAVDILINNAGVGDQALYDRADWTRIHRMIQVNVVALALLTHHLVPSMVARGRGGILNIGSGAGWALMPGGATYAATKHFVDGFTETLRLELQGTGVVVTQVLPGPVDTEFNEAAGIQRFAGGPPQFIRVSVRQCAREAIQGFERGRPVVLPGLAYRTMMRALDVMPRSVQRLILRDSARQLRQMSSPPDTSTR